MTASTEVLPQTPMSAGPLGRAFSSHRQTISHPISARQVSYRDVINFCMTFF